MPIFATISGTISKTISTVAQVVAEAYPLLGRVLDLAGFNFTANQVSDISDEDNDAILYSARGVSLDGVGDYATLPDVGTAVKSLTLLAKSGSNTTVYATDDAAQTEDASGTIVANDTWQEVTITFASAISGAIRLGTDGASLFTGEIADVKFYDAASALIDQAYLNEHTDTVANSLNGLPLVTRNGNVGTYTGCAAVVQDGGATGTYPPQVLGMDFNQSSSPAYAMQFNVKTDNAGTSGTDQVTLPWLSGGDFDCVVDWGDGTTDTITTYNDAAWTHTFAGGAGTYTVTITGEIGRLYFTGGGDCLKIVGTVKGGGLGIGITSIQSAFWGCNVTGYSHDLLKMSAATSCRSAWQNNNLTSWTADLPSSLAVALSAWQNNNLTSWTVDLPSSLTNCNSAWRDNNLTSWTGAIPATSACTQYPNAWTGNALDETSVNYILTQIDAAGTSNGSLGISGGTNATPTGAGATAVTNLQSRGWTVATN